MLLELDGQGPMYQQLSRALRHAVQVGRLPPGKRLPSTRDLCQSVRVSRNTVRSAYQHLTAAGVVGGRHGSGTFALAPAKSPLTAAHQQHLTPQSRFSARTRAIHDYAAPRLHTGLRFNLQYGEPLTDPLLPDLWRRELARAAAYTSSGYPPMQGLVELRQSVASYLSERRGIVAVRPRYASSQSRLDLAPDSWCAAVVLQLPAQVLSNPHRGSPGQQANASTVNEASVSLSPASSPRATRRKSKRSRASSLLRASGRSRCFRDGAVRLGHWLLRPPHLSPCGDRAHRLVAGSGVFGRDVALPLRCARHH
ncbi:MAG: GntR family transcriptional regulator, partial [Hyphomicrobium sp.]|nr:GntR family transcriptional regulator [Hyphomicrobium sp.]